MLSHCLFASVVVHLVLTCVMSLFARHRVAYLSLAWIIGIFTAVIATLLPFCGVIESSAPGILHPALLLALTATVFLQSIYPLSITMPAYLQWGRSWRYASPAIALFAVYGVLLLVGHRPTVLRSWADVQAYFFSSDIILRIAMLGLSIYYIVNIFHLPRVMLRNPATPHYLFGYALALGLSLCLYTWLAVDFSVQLLCVWTLVFTLLNMYLCFRTLETIALELPLPAMLDEQEVEAEPEVGEETATEQHDEDFNEANLRRFEQMEHWMQHNRSVWRDYKFSRDNLCAATGINRYLMLQSVRSQGYYNIHEYIARHRIAEVERMIRRGEAHSVQDCLDAGFASTKTLRQSFEKFTGKNLDAQFQQRKQ